MRVAIFGTGYVGLVTDRLARSVTTICVDIDPAKVDGLNQGIVPIYEPGLSPMVKANHAAVGACVSPPMPSAIAHGDVVYHRGGDAARDGSRDPQYVLAVVTDDRPLS